MYSRVPVCHTRVRTYQPPTTANAMRLSHKGPISDGSSLVVCVAVAEGAGGDEVHMHMHKGTISDDSPLVVSCVLRWQREQAETRPESWRCPCCVHGITRVAPDRLPESFSLAEGAASVIVLKG
jgi:hypothetical protein